MATQDGKKLTASARGQSFKQRDRQKRRNAEAREKTAMDMRRAPRKRSRSAKQGGIDQFVGMLAGKSRKAATIEEINEATAKAWAAGISKI